MTATRAGFLTYFAALGALGWLWLPGGWKALIAVPVLAVPAMWAVTVPRGKHGAGGSQGAAEPLTVPPPGFGHLGTIPYTQVAGEPPWQPYESDHAWAMPMELPGEGETGPGSEPSGVTGPAPAMLSTPPAEPCCDDPYGTHAIEAWAESGFPVEWDEASLAELHDAPTVFDDRVVLNRLGSPIRMLLPPREEAERLADTGDLAAVLEPGHQWLARQLAGLSTWRTDLEGAPA